MTRVYLAMAALLIAWPDAARADIKRVPYPEVRVETAVPVSTEPAFATFWKAFSDAVASRNADALFALVGPTFAWTARGALIAEFDPGRDALHNFKVVFGFRRQGADEDGGVEQGPYWDALAQFVSDPVFYSGSDKVSLICGPLLAEVTDAAVLDRAQEAITIGDDSGAWYFTAGDVPVARTRTDTGPPIGRLNKAAFPVLGTYPPRDAAAASAPTHYEVLLPSGATGWIVAGTARSLGNDRLCYAKTREGRWRIVDFDQGQDDD
jgi:hypothetical protein